MPLNVEITTTDGCKIIGLYANGTAFLHNDKELLRESRATMAEAIEWIDGCLGTKTILSPGDSVNVEVR